MRLVWIGMHAEGIPAFEALLAAGAPLVAAFTLPPELAEKRGGAGGYRDVCHRYGVPLYYVSDINSAAARAIVSATAPDVAFVIGWHQFVRPETLRLARVGMISVHASLLPHNRGSAPINWAIIRGESQTGATLFWLAEEMDAGDIIDQTAFPITPYDTAASLYAHVAVSTRDMLLRLLPRLQQASATSQFPDSIGFGSTVPIRLRFEPMSHPTRARPAPPCRSTECRSRSRAGPWLFEAAVAAGAATRAKAEAR